MPTTINLENVLMRGLRSAQPAAGVTAEGTLYFVTDEGVTEQVRSATWVTYSNTTATIGSGQIVSGFIASGQVGGFHLSSGCVTSGRIASGQVGGFHLSSGCVTSGLVASGQLGSFHLGSGAIVSGRVASGVIGQFHMGTNNHVAVVDRAYSEYTTSTTLSTAIPVDNTIPQSGEGTEVLTATITPKSTTNIIRVTFMCFGAIASGTVSSAALFKDSDANALQATTVQGTGDFLTQLSFAFEQVAGTTSAVTYKIRVGPNTGTMALNGNVGIGRIFGGIARAVLIVEEIVP